MSTPVLVSGSVGASGFLVGMDPVTTVVEVVSANLAEFVWVGPGEALGRRLGDVLGSRVADVLAADLPAAADGVEYRSARLPPVGPAAESGGPRARWTEFDVRGHRTRHLWVLEFEPAPRHHVAVRSLYDRYRRSLQAHGDVGEGGGVVDRCQAAVRELRGLTGFDRALVYRFDRSSPGEVIAEDRAPGVASFLGSSFSPTAIPAPVRAHYQDRGLRVVPEVGGVPVPLLTRPGCTVDPLDLPGPLLVNGAAANDSYLLSLGVAAFMTMPLVVDGELWGLLVCQHRTPRAVSYDVQGAAEMLGLLLSLDIRSSQRAADDSRLSRLGGLVVDTVAAMAQASSLGDGATAVPEALLGLAAADGVILQLGERRVTAGRTPPPDALDPLVQAVAALAEGSGATWVSDAFPTRCAAAGLPALGDSAATVAGVLFAPFTDRRTGFALWLRAETVRTITWAADGGQSSAGPEEVRGRSRPWLAAEIAAAETFANAVPPLQLERATRVLAEQELQAATDRAAAAVHRQELERQLHQQQRLESLGRLAGGVAHDFNNLLAVIVTYAEFVGDEVDPRTRTITGDGWAAVAADVEHIKTAARRAADLTHQLLAFARQEVITPQALDLNDVIGGLEDLLRRTLGDTVSLQTDLAGGLDPILADPGQIEQILVNLVVNARDAMPGGGQLLIATAASPPPGPSPSPPHPDVDPVPGPAGHRGEPHPDRWVQLQVTDTGTGIPRAVADRIFEPFFTTKAVGEGTGLGLATVHGIVEQAGGTIAVSSEPGRGTTFTVTFPSTTVAPAPSAAARPVVHAPAAGKTVLLVEDGSDLRDITHRLLTRAGYAVLAAADGPTAIAVAADHPGPIDLLLTDLVLPVLTGDDAAVAIHRTHPDIRVVFMSGYASPLLASRTDLPFPYVLLDKPFTRTTLLGVLTDATQTASVESDRQL